MSHRFVKKATKSPSTAKFGSVFSGDWQDPDKVTEYLGKNKYRIRAWVDSQNSFGATIRTNFTCVVKQNGDAWSCESLKFDE